MPYINSTNFGNITIDDTKLTQVLLIKDQVIERDYPKLKELFGTSHKIGDWEIEMLFTKSPEIILIGNGTEGKFEIHPDIIKKTEELNIKLIVELTPQAIVTYNKLFQEGKKVNALIHTTC